MSNKLNQPDDIIKISSDTEFNKTECNYVQSEQSANVLFKFMDKPEYLKGIIKDKAIRPRYYPEKIEYLGIDNFDEIAFPMICFCDIYLNRLIPHMKFYGTYGIGLSKQWGIGKGIQPVHYINELSPLKNDYSFIFSRAFQLDHDDKNLISDYNNYLLTYLLFIKPIHGNMFRNNRYEKRNFHDEKEWRYIPNLGKTNTELPFLIPREQMNPTAYTTYSNAISQCNELWLRFEYDSIKYIIVENSSDRKDMINFILNEIEAEQEQKFELISRILVFNELKEDW